MDSEVKTVTPDVAVVMLHAVIASDYQGTKGLVGAGEGLLMVANTIEALQARVRELEERLEGAMDNMKICERCEQELKGPHDER